MDTDTTDLPEVNLLISVPSCRDWKFAFGGSITGLTNHISRHGIKGIKLRYELWHVHGSSCPSQFRQRALNKAIQEGFTHLLMIDDDMYFPSDILDTLFSRNLPIVTINARRKNPKAFRCTAMDMDGNMIDSRGKEGVEEVAWVGVCAFGLIDIGAIKHIAPPHFECRWLPERNDYLSEDYYFCAKMRDNGMKIFIDHDASRRIGHIGDFIYGFGEE